MEPTSYISSIPSINHTDLHQHRHAHVVKVEVDLPQRVVGPIVVLGGPDTLEGGEGLGPTRLVLGDGDAWEEEWREGGSDEGDLTPV